MNNDILPLLIKQLSYKSQIRLKLSMSQVFTSFAAQIEQEVDNSFAQSKGLLLIMDNIPIGDDYFVPQYRIDRQTSWPHLLPSSITEACDLPVDGELEQAFFYADLAEP